MFEILTNIDISTLIFKYELGDGCINIEEGIFSNKPFESLTSLTFQNAFKNCGENNILTKAMFTKYLAEFNIQPWSFAKIKFEDEFLSIFKYTQILQFQYCLSSDIEVKNLFGQSNIQVAAVTVDIRFNRLNTLLDNSFLSISSVQQLFLSYCTIKTIEEDAFNNLRELRKLDLSNNNLQILSFQFGRISVLETLLLDNSGIEKVEDQTFKTVHKLDLHFTDNIMKELQKESFQFSNESLKGFYINKTTTNPEERWICSCNFAWIKEIDNDLNTTSCTRGSEIAPLNLLDFIEKNCTPGSNDNINTCRSPEANSGIIVKKITDKDIEISIDENEYKDSLELIYYDSEFKNYCQAEVFNQKTPDRGVSLIQIKEDTAYVLCLRNKSEDTVYPSNCTAARTLPNYDQQPWLVNKDRFFAYLTIAVSVVAAALIGCISFYFILRKHPNLLKNKKILLVKPYKKTTNPISNFIPIPPVRNPVMHDNIVSDINQVYLTPNPRRRRSLDETSSGKNSYAAILDPGVPGTPSLSEKVYNWRQTNLSHILNSQLHFPPAPSLPPRNNLFNSSLYQSHGADRSTTEEWFQTIHTINSGDLY